MIIRWRLATRGQKVWAAATLLLWITTITLVTTFEADGLVTRREIMALTTALVLSSCSTVCLKVENSHAKLDGAFLLGYRCAEMGLPVMKGSQVVPAEISMLPDPRNHADPCAVESA